MNVERREFQLDRNLIKSIIRAQSGSLEKALLELITNAVDADATQVHVDVHLHGFSVRDNGKGFSEDQFHELFGRFGFEHSGEYERGIGRFGIGRGQVFALARTRYATGTIRALVDIEGEGYGYEVSRSDASVEGVEVCGELYRALNGMELLAVQTELERLCHYAPLKVFFNGRLISRDPADEKWDAEDDVAYYRCRQTHRMEIYSQGFFVCQQYSGTWGGGGVIVSKRGKAFEQNTARNDILQHCEVFGVARQVMKELIRKANTEGAKRNVVTDASLSARVREILSMTNGLDAYAAINSEKLFTLVDGKRVSFAQLQDRKVWTVTEQKTLLAERMLRSGVAVLADKTLDRFSVRTLQDLIGRISDVRERSFSRRRSFDFVIYEDIASVPGFAAENFTIAKVSELSQRAKEALSVANHFNRSIALACGEEPRRLIPGVSEGAYGWTDGASFIAIERRVLHNAGTNGYPAWHELLAVMVHEYCHSSSSDIEHGHPIEFWERFAELISRGVIGNIARGMYARHCKHGKQVTKTKLSALASMSELDSPVSIGDLAA